MSRFRLKGVSLFEIVIVIAIFSTVAILSTRSTFLTLRGTRKSDSQIKVKENLEYGISVIERQLRNAASCVSSSSSRVDYVDSQGVSSFFACQSIGATSGYIASGSARLTSDEITITSCSFVCSAQDGSTLQNVTVDVSASDLQSSGAETAQVTVSTQVFLRTY